MTDRDLPDDVVWHINLYCLEEVLINTRGQLCGCPACCAANGSTALYTLQDFKLGVHPLAYWSRCVCKEKLALLCKERIVPGWPGGEADGHRTKGPVFIMKG